MFSGGPLSGVIIVAGSIGFMELSPTRNEKVWSPLLRTTVYCAGRPMNFQGAIGIRSRLHGDSNWHIFSGEWPEKTLAPG